MRRLLCVVTAIKRLRTKEEKDKIALFEKKVELFKMKIVLFEMKIILFGWNCVAWAKVVLFEQNLQNLRENCTIWKENYTVWDKFALFERKLYFLNSSVSSLPSACTVMCSVVSSLSWFIPYLSRYWQKCRWGKRAEHGVVIGVVEEEEKGEEAGWEWGKETARKKMN